MTNAGAIFFLLGLTGLLGNLFGEAADDKMLRSANSQRKVGECIGADTFSSIPFTASAYDACTAFHEKSTEKFGVCGDKNLSLDGQPNEDAVCAARGGECHVAFTEPGEWLEYSFNVPENANRQVYNIIARVASEQPRDFLIEIDNGGNALRKTLTAPGKGFFEFEDVMWEQVSIPGRGPERIFVEFFDGHTNFCSLRVEETTWAYGKTLTIPFDSSAQTYISFIEKSTDRRSGTCGPGWLDSQPTSDSVCNERHAFCNIGWTEPGEEATYEINNDQALTVQKDVTLRLASLKSGRRVSVEIEGGDTVQVFEAPGKGYHEYEDFIWSNASFLPGKSRLVVKFLDRGINLCSVSVK